MNSRDPAQRGADAANEREVCIMAVIYKRMIENGKMTLADVPARWRAAVQALIAKD